ncbi:hypothetical protein K474DRAFT_373929 [Panus rudis PR-1116 ss-1]|nr:hypothetical protein K474DRAFT_373929 [Panus rudis PR-1116 ss-1]
MMGSGHNSYLIFFEIESLGKKVSTAIVRNVPSHLAGRSYALFSTDLSGARRWLTRKKASRCSGSVRAAQGTNVCIQPSEIFLGGMRQDITLSLAFCNHSLQAVYCNGRATQDFARVGFDPREQSMKLTRCDSNTSPKVSIPGHSNCQAYIQVPVANSD